VFAPQDGVIMGLTVGEGMFVKPGQTVYSLADLSRVWIKADVFEAQAGQISAGQEAELSFPYMPGESWAGAVGYVYPEVDPQSRTVQVRLSFANVDGRLKPNMYGDVTIATDAEENALSIPKEALIRTGKTDRVILAVGEGRFRPAEVVAGAEVEERVIILKGLNEGEEVVTSGQFLIDSEASLNGAFLRMLDKTHAVDNESESEQVAEVHHGMGTLDAVKDHETVTLTHDPIESLGWPAMTMDFKVAPSVDLSPFEIGDRIHFTIVRTEEGPFMITMAMKM
jgi:Cu(I)/Ag(I) efflux system membrane fusion protein